MIKTKHDMYQYTLEDSKAFGKPERPSLSEKIKNWIFPNNSLRYLKCLRKLEYYTNTGSILRFYYTRKLAGLKRITGIQLEPNCAGPGLHITHGHIVVNPQAKLGRQCKIMQFVTIGGEGRYDKDGAPIIGNRVFIGAGAQIIGNVEIADDVVIGANAVVVKDITEPGITVAGVPAKKVSNESSWHYLNRK